MNNLLENTFHLDTINTLKAELESHRRLLGQLKAVYDATIRKEDRSNKSKEKERLDWEAYYSFRNVVLSDINAYNLAAMALENYKPIALANNDDLVCIG